MSLARQTKAAWAPRDGAKIAQLRWAVKLCVSFKSWLCWLLQDMDMLELIELYFSYLPGSLFGLVIVSSLNSHDLWQDPDVPMEDVLFLFAFCCLCEKGTASGTFSAVLYNLLVVWFSGWGRGHCAVPSICPNEWRRLRLSCVHFPPWRHFLRWAISGYAQYLSSINYI